MLENTDPDSNLQTTVWNSIAAVWERLEAQGEYLEVVLGLVNEVHSDMLESGNFFGRLKGSLKCNLKKVERKVGRFNKKIFTLENSRIGPSVVSSPGPTYFHMQALGGIDVAAFFSQVKMFFTKRHLNRDKINLPESQLNSGMDSFDFNYNHTPREPEDVAPFLDNIGAPDI